MTAVRSRQPWHLHLFILEERTPTSRHLYTLYNNNIIVVIVARMAVLGPPLQSTIVTCTLFYQRRTRRE